MLAAVLKAVRPNVAPLISSGLPVIGSFLRGVIIARLLGVENFGVAVILITLAAGYEMIIDGGFDQYIIRSKTNLEKRAVETAIFLKLCLSAGLLICTLPFYAHISNLLNIYEYASLVAITLCIASLKSAVNLGYRAAVKHGHFQNELIIEGSRFVAEIGTLLLLISLGYGIWALPAAQAVTVAVIILLSNMLSTIRFRIALDRRARMHCLGFSLPIILNSVLLILSLHGDRYLVAWQFTPDDVAHFAASAAIGQALVALLTRFGAVKITPVIAQTIQREGRRSAVISQYLGMFRLFGLAYLLFSAFVAPVIVEWIYGPTFVDIHELIFVIAAVHFVQLQQVVASAALIAIGQTRIFSWVTIPKTLALAGSLLAISIGVIAIPLALAIGSIAGVALCLYGLQQAGASVRREFLIIIVYVVIWTVALFWFVTR
jgi:O-antigen/teichoic acid export membrane protein